ncbi:unnamed protein product, partial [Effrenium voratum]
SLLPKLYLAAEGMCLLEMCRSTPWRVGRLLPVLAALDELRRVSERPEQLSSPEAAQLNKGAGFWAWAALVEAALLGVVCSFWARHLGCYGGRAAITGLGATLVAALPATVVLAVTFTGWYSSEQKMMALTKSHSRESPEQLGRYDLGDLEDRYLQTVANYYPNLCESPTDCKLSDYEYYRLKVRLEAA